DVHGARDVGAIAPHRTAEIEHDRVAVDDATVARVVVWRRAVRAGPHNRESDFVVALCAEELSEVRADLPLRPAREPALEDPRIRAVGGLRHRAKCVDFACVFPYAQLA